MSAPPTVGGNSPDLIHQLLELFGSQQESEASNPVNSETQAGGSSHADPRLTHLANAVGHATTPEARKTGKAVLELGVGVFSGNPEVLGTAFLKIGTQWNEICEGAKDIAHAVNDMVNMMAALFGADPNLAHAQPSVST